MSSCEFVRDCTSKNFIRKFFIYNLWDLERIMRSYVFVKYSVPKNVPRKLFIYNFLYLGKIESSYEFAKKVFTYKFEGLREQCFL